MFTENEVDALILNDEIKQAIQDLRSKFLKAEAAYLEIDDHDFLALTILTPSVGISLANGSVSLFEEISLNKKARKLSKGGYFMKKDPVVVAMGYLIKNYDKWHDEFYEFLKFLMEQTFDRSIMLESKIDRPEVSEADLCREGLKTPFIFIRFLTSFFLDDEEEDIAQKRNISKVELARITEIGEKIGFNEIPLFRKFMTNFIVR